MAIKPIIWSLRANPELKEVLEFYLKWNKNPDYSLKILNELERLLGKLSTNELLGRKTSNYHTRVLVMHVYLIFYEVTAHQI